VKFLVVKTSSLGDIIQTFPVVEYLKKKFPAASIDWVVEQEYIGLVGAHPLIRQAIPFGIRAWRKKRMSFTEMAVSLGRLRQEKYDVLFDLQGNTKSSLITACARAHKKVGLGWKSVTEFPNFFVTNHHVEVNPSSQIQEKYLYVVQHYFNDKEPFLPEGVALKLTPEEETELQQLGTIDRPKYMVACNSFWVNKRLPEEVLRELLEDESEPYYFFIWGSLEEKQVAERLKSHFLDRSETIGNLTLPLWQALMRKMDLVIATDSAALALCGTTQTPSRSFFGPSKASVYKPLGDHHVAWQGACPYGKTFEVRCPILRTCKTGACLRSVSADQLKKEKSM